MEKVEPIMRANLLAVAKRYAKHEGISLQSLSRQAHGDPPFFDRLVKRKGSISGRKYDEVMAWFKKKWPDDLPWPADLTPVFQPVTGRAARRERRIAAQVSPQ